MTDLTIRAARPEDAAAIAAAESETAKTPGLLNFQPGELPVAHVEQTIRALGPTGAYVVAERAGIPVGHAFLETLGPTSRNHVRILNIVVHPGRTGKGIGRALLEHLIEWARADGARKIELTVRAKNAPARRLYEKLGFEIEGVLRWRLRLPDGSWEDDIAMALFLHDT